GFLQLPQEERAARRDPPLPLSPSHAALHVRQRAAPIALRERGARTLHAGASRARLLRQGRRVEAALDPLEIASRNRSRWRSATRRHAKRAACAGPRASSSDRFPASRSRSTTAPAKPASSTTTPCVPSSRI